MANEESAASAYKRRYLMRKMEFKENADNCKNYFTDGCSYPWCDMCGGYEPRKGHEKDVH